MNNNIFLVVTSDYDFMVLLKVNIILKKIKIEFINNDIAINLVYFNHIINNNNINYENKIKENSLHIIEIKYKNFYIL